MASSRSTTGTVTVSLKRSPIGTPRRHRTAVRGLGLRRLHQSATHPDTEQVRGLIDKVGYLLEVRRP